MDLAASKSTCTATKRWRAVCRCTREKHDIASAQNDLSNIRFWEVSGHTKTSVQGAAGAVLGLKATLTRADRTPVFARSSGVEFLCAKGLFHAQKTFPTLGFWANENAGLQETRELPTTAIVGNQNAFDQHRSSLRRSFWWEAVAFGGFGCAPFRWRLA